MAWLAAIAVLAATYGFRRWMPFRIEISGTSMRPTLEPGDWAIATAAGRVRKHDLVVVEHPERPGFEMVKRVGHVIGDVAPDGTRLVDRVWVEGDEPASSTDSRAFGPVPTDLIVGRVRLVWWPPGRIRLL